MWKLNDILGIIAPIVELLSFFILVKSQNITIKILEKNKNKRSFFDNIIFKNKDSQEIFLKRKKKILEIISYFFLFIGCIMWVLSSVFDHYNQ